MTTDKREVLHKIDELKHMVEELDNADTENIHEPRHYSVIVPSPTWPGTYS